MENLQQLSEIEDSLKAFAVSLCRYASKDPSVFLYLAQVDDNPEIARGWEELYQDLQDKNVLSGFSERTNKKANDYDWSEIETTYRNWGMFGWITDHSMIQFGFWDNCPASQVEADKQVLKNTKKDYLQKIISDTKKDTNNHRVYEEACSCFYNKCYHACASLLITLIDGELISSRANSVLSNRKTGAIAGQRVITNISQDEHYGEPGVFHLELLNYNAFIDMLFERANGFENEPNHINRNFIHHGMSRRKVLRKDCVKLFVAYRRTLRYSKHYIEKV